MKTQNSKKKPDKERIKEFLHLHAYVLINRYIIENVVFKRLKPNDKVPVRQYLEDLGFRKIDEYLDDLNVNGLELENDCVIDKDFNKRCFELFKTKIQCVFYDAPIGSRVTRLKVYTFEKISPYFHFDI